MSDGNQMILYKYTYPLKGGRQIKSEQNETPP